MEKFCLKWNDFQQNITTTYSNLRKQEELFDVTLVTDDGKQYSSHKLVLASSSDFFQNIVHNSKNKQIDFLIYLAGVRSVELENILDYIYAGEVQLYQDDLDNFLDIAQKLKIKGLIGNDEERKSKIIEEEFIPEETVYQNQFQNVAKNEGYNENEEKSIVHSSINIIRKKRSGSNSTVNQSDINVKEILKNMISQVGEKWKCNNCDKEAKTKGSIELHAEIHIEGLEFNCNKCDKTFRSRNQLAAHKSRFH